MKIKLNKTHLEISNDEITSIKADALIFPTNDYLWMGNEISSEIKKQAGSIVEQEATEKGPCELGESIVTEAGKLPYTYLVHCVCMGQDGRIDDNAVKGYMLKALSTCQSYNCSTIVLIPCYLTSSHASPYIIAEKTVEACIEYCMGKTIIKSLIILVSGDQLRTTFIERVNTIFSRKK
ncbi:MAG: macro domain-containing protein [Candidatus Auribacterota bacterium]